MTETEQPTHPFQPGAVVAVRVNSARIGFMPHHWRIDTVLKVHKSGKFTLEGGPKQQWIGRPAGLDSYRKPKAAEGHMAGQHYGTLHLLDDIIDTVDRDNALYARWQRWEAVDRALYRLSYERVSDDSLDHLEAAIKVLNTAKPKVSA